MIEIEPIEYNAIIKNIDISGASYTSGDKTYYNVDLYDENSKIIKRILVGLETNEINKLIIDKIKKYM